MKEMTLCFILVLCMGATFARTVPETQHQLTTSSLLRISNTSKEAQLRAFIELNQTADVIKLIEDGVNLNFKYEDGEYPIHLAVKAGNKNIVESLVDHGAEVITKNFDEQTSLHMAVERGDLDIIKLLIENGAQVDGKDSSNRTALHLAAKGARLDIVQYLVENAATVKNPALLHWAVKGGDVDVIKFLIKQGADVNDNQSLLHYAIAEGRPEVVKILIENDANVNVKGRNEMSPLHVAVLKGDIDIVKLILDHGVEKIDDTDKEGNTALLYSSSAGNREISKLLIQNGANMFSTGWGQFTFYKWAEEDNFFLEELEKDKIEQDEMRKKKTPGAET